MTVGDEIMNDDLISRKALLEQIKKKIYPEKFGVRVNALDVIGAFLQVIDEMPVAYNVKNVIKQLEGEEFLTTNDDGETDNLSISVMEAEKVYEIVHSGFKND